MLPVIVKGKGKIDEVFKDDERVPSTPDEAGMQMPWDNVNEDWQTLQEGLFRLVELQDMHPVIACVQFWQVLLRLKLADRGHDVPHILLKNK